MVVSNPLPLLMDDCDENIRPCGMYTGGGRWKRVLLLLRQRRLQDTNTLTKPRDTSQAEELDVFKAAVVSRSGSVPATGRSGEQLWREAFYLVHGLVVKPGKIPPSIEAGNDTSEDNDVTYIYRVGRSGRELWTTALCLVHRHIATGTRLGGTRDVTVTSPLKRKHATVAGSSNICNDMEGPLTKCSRVQRGPKELWRNAFSLVYNHIDSEGTMAPEIFYSQSASTQHKDSTDNVCNDCGTGMNSVKASTDNHCPKALWKRAIALAETEALWRELTHQTQTTDNSCIGFGNGKDDGAVNLNTVLDQNVVKTNIDTHCPKALWKRAIALAEREVRCRKLISQTQTTDLSCNKCRKGKDDGALNLYTLLDQKTSNDRHCPKALWKRAINLAAREASRWTFTHQIQTTDSSCSVCGKDKRSGTCMDVSDQTIDGYNIDRPKRLWKRAIELAENEAKLCSRIRLN